MVEKSVMYEEAVRIPWLMRIPRLGGGGRTISKPVSQIDVVPTLLDLFGIDCDRNFPGQSLVPLIKGKAVSQEDVFIQWNPNSGALKVKKGGTKLASKAALKHIENEHNRAVISPDGWKLCLSDVDKSQLFNLREDPGETKNLFDSTKHQDIVSKLTEKIYQWQNQVKDTVEV
jgi:arylsulfatase A-like enzyme